MKISLVWDAYGRDLQTTASISVNALRDSAEASRALAQGTAQHALRVVTITTFSQEAWRETPVWTASGQPEVTSAFVS